MELTLERVNNALKRLNKRVRATNLIKQSGIVYYFRLNNGKHLIVFFQKMYGEYVITHILIQCRAHQPYSFLCNGQPSRNTELLYRYNYEEETL